MKNVFLLLLIPILSLASCSKNSDSNSNNNNNGGGGTIDGCGGPVDASKGQITFKVNGTQVSSYNHTCSWSTFPGGPNDGHVMNFTSSMNKDRRTTVVNISNWGTGTYNIGDFTDPGVAYGSYHPDYCDISSSASFKALTVNITHFDTTAKMMEGTFSGTASLDGTDYQITEGKISNCKMDRFYY